MKLTINRYALVGSQTEVIMEHGDETIVWNIALFDKMGMEDRLGFEERVDKFEQINAYWNYLPAPKQKLIFELYKRVREIFDTTWDTNNLTKQLYDVIAELYQQHDLSDICHWVKFHGNLVVPNDVKDVFDDDNGNRTREKTYIKEDYEWLLSLSVALRIMIPIWGEYIARTRKESGNKFKEYYAFKLLAHSYIFKSEPMERLRIYVEKSLPTDRSIASAIYGGVSSEDFPTWILGLVVINRLAVSDIRGIIPDTSLIKQIFKFVGGKVKGHDSTFMGIINNKIFEGQNQDSENNLSKLEGYKIKQEIPAGDIAILCYYLKDTDNLALSVCPDIDLALVRESVASVKELETEQIKQSQITLLQWVLKTLIPPKGIMYVNKRLIVNAVGVVQALLWHRQHYDLAALVSAVSYNGNNDMATAASDSRARILKEQLETLDVFYPYSRKPTGKQRVVKRINPAVESIDLLSTNFSQHEWKLTLPPSMLMQVTGSATNRRYVIPYDFKIKIAALVISLANRTFSTRGEVNESNRNAGKEVFATGNWNLQSAIPTTL